MMFPPRRTDRTARLEKQAIAVQTAQRSNNSRWFPVPATKFAR